MSKGLYHCSKCKKHFYDAEATEMHIRDAHGGHATTLRHPTKRELLLRDEQQRARITALEAQLKEAALQSLAALGQAQEACDAQKAAEAKLATATEAAQALDIALRRKDAGKTLTVEEITGVVEARVALAKIKGEG